MYSHSTMGGVRNSLPFEGTVEAIADDIVGEGVLGAHDARNACCADRVGDD